MSQRVLFAPKNKLFGIMAIELQWEKKRGSKWSVHIKGIQLADGAYARQIYLTERTKVSILNQMVGIFHFHFQTGSYDRANTRLRTNIGRCRLLH